MKLPDKIVKRATAKLIPYARNSRIHSERQIAQIAASIREFSFTNPVLIDGDDGIIAGHGRVLAAHTLGLAEVPCIVLDHLTELQKRAYVIADNRLAENAGWDDAALSAELARLEEDGFNLALTGFDPIELRGLIADEDHLDPTDGRAERGTELPRLWIDDRAVLITAEERDMLQAAYDRHMEAYGVADGFVAGLLAEAGQ
jgi:ParB-like chromosome segregation protein Spo0J